MSSFRKFWSGFFLDEHEEYLMIYKGLLICSFLIFVALTINIWGMERAYPLVPYFSFLEVPLSYHLYVSGALVASLLWGLFSKKSAPLLVASVLMVVLGLLDSLRVQPYLYELALLISLLGVYRLKLKSFGRDQWLLASQLVIAGLYIWAGVYKLNAHFFTGTLPWIMSPLVSLVPDWEQGISLVSKFAPFFEIFLGVALMTKTFRTSAVWSAAVFHFFILFLIGPFGLAWNSTVWFWDFLQILLVFILFYPDTLSRFSGLSMVRKSLVSMVVTLLVMVLPVLSFFSLWPQYLSSAVYTGSDIRAYLLFDEYVLKSLPTEMQRMTTENTNTGYQISFLDWASAMSTDSKETSAWP